MRSAPRAAVRATSATTPASASTVGTSPWMSWNASRSWAPTPTSSRAAPVVGSTHGAAHLEPGDLADEHAVLDHRHGARRLDQRASEPSSPSSTGGGGSSRAAPASPPQAPGPRRPTRPAAVVK